MVMGAIDQLPFEVWGWEGETRWSTRLRVEATIPSSCGDLSRVQVSVPQPLNAADLGRRVCCSGHIFYHGFPMEPRQAARAGQCAGTRPGWTVVGQAPRYLERRSSLA